MRVAILDPSCFTVPYDTSLCNGLVKQGCQVLFVGSCDYNILSNYHINYEYWNHFYKFANRLCKTSSCSWRRYIKGIEHFWGMRKLVYRLRKWSPDIIHFEWLPLPLIDYWFLPYLRKIAPLVLTVHNTDPFHGNPSSKIQLIGLYNALHKFDHYIVHTKFSFNELIRNTHVPESKISIVPHGIFDYYKNIRNETQKQDIVRKTNPNKIILFFGLIKPYKGLDFLIKAFSLLPNKLLKETRLLVAGYPKMSINIFKELAMQLGVADLIIWDLRFIPEEEVPLIFESAYVVALPYLKIDQSGVLMTALAFKKPIVAFKVGGFLEVLKDGVTGYLVEPGNIYGLSKALRQILSRPQIAQQMSRSIEKMIEDDLSWESVAKKTVQIYKFLEGK